MANVKITEKLTNEILRHVAAPFTERYKTAATMTADDSKLVYDALFITPRQFQLLKEIPNKWVNISHVENMRQPMFVGHVMAGTHRDRHWLQLVPTNSECFFSYSWTSSPCGSVIDGIQDQYHNWIKTDLTAVGLSKNYIAELEQICTERDQALATVKKMLEGCSTLNQVEKIWPAIRKYVSAETLQRLDHKPERKTARSVGVDDEELQSLSVHHIRLQMTS